MAKRTKKLTEAQKSEIIGKYTSGSGITELSREYNLTRQAIGGLLQRENVSRHKRSKSVKDLDNSTPKVPPKTTLEGNASDDGAREPASKGRKATADGLMDASIIAIIPKELKINSTIFQMAKTITETEPRFNWPVMSPGDWLDTYLIETMKKMGVTIGAYRIEDRKDG